MSWLFCLMDTRDIGRRRVPDIKLENLVKRYGNVEVLHGISLSMKKNEFTVFVGPSGCGKSTTLRMIAGLESVTSGEIYISGKPVSHLEPKARDLAMVFQDYALYPHMNVAQNMSFALRLARRPKAEINAKVNDVAEILGLKELLHRKPGELSGGQRQRVAMGRALTRDSGTFLFDEPLSNLDAKLRSQMRAELALMRQRVKKNMIYVTHDQVEAMTLADRIVVMHDGHIQQEGSPEELYKRPVNKFVAGFLGSPQMNFLDARLEGRSGAVFVSGAGFKIRLPASYKGKLKGGKGEKVTLGIRPSDLLYKPTGSKKASNDRSLDLRVIVSEYIGAQSVLICDCAGAKVAVELKSDTPIALGEKLRFEANIDNIHLFEEKTQQVM